MNKIFKFIVIFFFLNSCSFDNKTGIWTGSNPIAKNKDSIDQNLELIFKKKIVLLKQKNYQIIKI